MFLFNINKTLKIIGFVPLIVWCILYLQTDLWYDEVYTLENFVLTDWRTTVTYYPAPNNHIFYNLLLQALTGLTGLRDIVTVAENVFILRAFQLLITLFTAYFASLIIKSLCKSDYYNWVYVVMFTTIPLLNFSLQIRGYMLSALLLTLLLYTIIKQEKSRYTYLQILLFTFLLLYTIPSNIYTIASVGVGIFMLCFNRKRNNYITIMFFIFLGILLSTVCYFPILNQVIDNKFSSREAPGTFYIASVFKNFILSFISKRIPFLLPILIGGSMYLIKKKNRYFLFLIITASFPFVFAFLHQKAVFERIFIPLTPVFAIVGTISFSYLIKNFVINKYRNVIIIITSTVWIGIALKEIYNNYHTVSEKIISSHKIIQNSYQNYYLSSIFKQDEVFKKLSKSYSGSPVFLYKVKDKYATKLYLKKNLIPYQTIDSLPQLNYLIKNSKKFYLITFNSEEVLKQLKYYKKFQSNLVLRKTYFSNIIVCVKK